MIEEIAVCNERLAKVSGAAATGKTEALIARAVELIRTGTDPSSRRCGSGWLPAWGMMPPPPARWQ